MITASSCKKEDEIDTQEESGTFTDTRDNKTYNWKKLGDLKWMTENLAYKPTGKVLGYLAYDNDEANVAMGICINMKQQSS